MPALWALRYVPTCDMALSGSARQSPKDRMLRARKVLVNVRHHSNVLERYCRDSIQRRCNMNSVVAFLLDRAAPPAHDCLVASPSRAKSSEPSPATSVRVQLCPTKENAWTLFRFHMRHLPVCSCISPVQGFVVLMTRMCQLNHQFKVDRSMLFRCALCTTPTWALER